MCVADRETERERERERKKSRKRERGEEEEGLSGEPKGAEHQVVDHGREREIDRVREREWQSGGVGV